MKFSVTTLVLVITLCAETSHAKLRSKKSKKLREGCTEITVRSYGGNGVTTYNTKEGVLQAGDTKSFYAVMGKMDEDEILGTVQGSCIRIPNDSWDCVEHTEFEDGFISGRHIEFGGAITQAIVGGTGTYFGAYGQATITPPSAANDFWTHVYTICLPEI